MPYRLQDQGSRNCFTPRQWMLSIVGASIYYAKIRKIVRSYEIVSLKNDVLTLRYYAEKAIGRDAGYVTKVFRRISSR